MSSTSWSTAPSPSPSGARRCTTYELVVGAVPDRQPVAPPQLARDAPGPDRLHPVEEDLLAAARVERERARCARPSMAGSASSSMSQNHCSETSGSIARAGALAEADRVGAAAPRATIRPSARSSATAASWPSSAMSPAHSGRRSRQPARRSSMTSACRARGRRPISKSIGSWPGVTLSAPVPKLGSTRSSATIGTGRSTSGTIAVRPTRSRPARVVGMHGDGDVGQDRHGPHGRDDDLAAALDVVGHLVQHVVDVCGARPRGRRWRSASGSTSSRGSGRGRCSPSLVQPHEHLDARRARRRRPS